MREILFRGKRVDNNEWVYGGIAFYNGDKPHIISGLYPVEVIPESLGQFTGLTDKNRNKIFEGDLLHTPGYYCEVKFIDGMFCSVYNHPEDGETLPLVDLSSERFEIIGNIYED